MDNQDKPDRRRLGCLSIGLIVICAACLTTALTIGVARYLLFPKDFKPVRLNAHEEEVLRGKVRVLTGTKAGAAAQGAEKSGSPLEPEPYSEAGARREVNLTERELNGLLAKNTQLANRLAIDLSDDLASAKLLLPLDPEFPILGGKTLKVTAGLELRYAGNKPVVILRGISVWGVPLPNAWIGGLKNINLVDEFGMNRGFWQTFAAGVENIRIEDGRLSLKLKP